MIKNDQLICSVYLNNTQFTSDHRFTNMEDYWGLDRTNGLNCTPPAIDDFPKDFFNEEERQAGAVVLHVLASLYLFAALAVVCDKYFVPAVEKICHALNMSNDVAGATFMAAATSAPELFVNVIGTFITEGDIGVGTIVGSAVFNILAVAACCGIGAGMVVPLDWWPLTRDCLAYGITVAILICIIHDERVEWYEALTLVLLYIVYIAVMYYDKSFQKCARGGVKQARSRSRSHNNSITAERTQNPGSLEAHFPLRIEHFQQNGNIKNIAHIDSSNNELSPSVTATVTSEIQKIKQSSSPSTLLLSASSQLSSSSITSSSPALIAKDKNICCSDLQQKNDAKINIPTLLPIGDTKKSKIESQVTIPPSTLTTTAGTTLGGSVIITTTTTAMQATSQPSIITTTTTNTKTTEKSLEEKAGDKNDNNNEANENEGYSLIRYPKGKSCFRQTTWIVIWPIHLLFFFTIPDCERKRLKKLFPLTFLMCIIWIGSLSYMVAWMITIIGDTLKIPDSVMGITFLAAGTSVPEAVSSVIVAKQGHGSMGISNSIGSNTFDILLCLGLPWLIKAAFLPIEPGHHWVGINSAGLEYSAISLLSTLLMLYITFSWNKFKLDRKVGHACLIMYAVFLILASLIELNVFFRVNLPTCGR